MGQSHERAAAVLRGLAAVFVLLPTSTYAQVIDFHFVDSEAHTFTEDEMALVRSLGESAFAEIAALIDVPDRVRVTVQTGPQIIPETGDGGAAVAPGHVSWTVDPSREGGVAAIARARLRPTLFHEIHHLVRGWTFNEGTAGTRMIDAAAAEGLATAFERDHAGVAPPWGEYDGEDIESWLDELIEIDNLGPYMQWMFQHPDGRRWIGYRAGTYLADRAMSACDCTSADLVGVSTDELLSSIGR